MAGANRVISTTLKLDGEAEFKSALTSIKAELGNLGSALKLVESQYRENANSLDALEAKQKALTDIAGKLGERLEQLQKAHDAAAKAQKEHADAAEKAKAAYEAAKNGLDELGKRTYENAAEYDKLTQAMEKAGGELSAHETLAQKAADSAQNYQKAINLTGVELNTLNDELKTNDQYLGEAKASAGTPASKSATPARSAKRRATASLAATSAG